MSESAIDKARAAWGDKMPDWILALARECVATSQAKVAARMGRSATMISQVLNSKYPGDLEAVEEVFRGVFQGATIACPALGNLPTHECREWRAKARQFVNVNSLRVRMYRACAACPNNRKDEA